jgi:hypothetical protein
MGIDVTPVVGSGMTHEKEAQEFINKQRENNGTSDEERWDNRGVGDG